MLMAGGQPESRPEQRRPRPAARVRQSGAGGLVLTRESIQRVGSWTVTSRTTRTSTRSHRSGERLTDPLYRTAGTGKHRSRNESVATSGGLTVADRTVDIEDAPGRQVHTGTHVTPPENWTWPQCNDLAENDSAVLETLRLEDTLSVCLRVDGDGTQTLTSSTARAEWVGAEPPRRGEYSPDQP